MKYMLLRVYLRLKINAKPCRNQTGCQQQYQVFPDPDLSHRANSTLTSQTLTDMKIRLHILLFNSLLRAASQAKASDVTEGTVLASDRKAGMGWRRCASSAPRWPSVTAA